MKQELNHRMETIRLAAGTPGLTPREQRLLVILLTYMPFNLDFGWQVSVGDLARYLYGVPEDAKPSEKQKDNTSRTLHDLLDKGLIRIHSAKFKTHLNGFNIYFLDFESFCSRFESTPVLGGNTTPCFEGEVPPVSGVNSPLN